MSVGSFSSMCRFGACVPDPRSSFFTTIASLTSWRKVEDLSVVETSMSRPVISSTPSWPPKVVLIVGQNFLSSHFSKSLKTSLSAASAKPRSKNLFAPFSSSRLSIEVGIRWKVSFQSPEKEMSDGSTEGTADTYGCRIRKRSTGLPLMALHRDF